MTDTAPLIEVTGLIHRYAGRQVLSVPDWRLMPHEHQLLIGPSGSGKTTLLGILSGLLSPSEGAVEVLGRSLGQMSARALSEFRAPNFGFVFQDHHLVSSLSVEENLKLARQFAGLDDDAGWSGHLMERLGLTYLARSKPNALSHGEAQRAAIARAAVTRPRLLLADEPTSALDDENAENVMALLKTLSDEVGSTMLVASHDARVKPFFAQSLALSKPEDRAA